MMTSTTDEDPFIEVQTDVTQALEQTRQAFSSYLRIRSTAQSLASPELEQSKADLEQALNELSTDLLDLADSIKVVETDPYKYGLEIEEVSRRRRFVKEVEGEVEDMMEELKKAVGGPSSSISEQRRSAMVGQFAEGDRPRDVYSQWEQEQQLAMIAEQDEVLDDVYRTVGSLRDQAHEMGRELGEQTEMLEEVDKSVERVQDKITHGVKRVAWVIKKNEDTASSFCIAFLILILIILLILLLVI